jgi:hypothetical protein
MDSLCFALGRLGVHQREVGCVALELSTRGLAHPLARFLAPPFLSHGATATEPARRGIPLIVPQKIGDGRYLTMSLGQQLPAN